MKDHQAAEDRKFRERLEKQASGGQRADIVSGLNQLAIGEATARPGLSSYLLLQLARRGEQLHRRRIAELNAKHDFLDPRSELKRAAVEQVKDAGGGFVGTSQDRRDYAPDTLSVEAMNTLALARSMANRYS
jgi:hypothetical protein